MKRLRIGRRRAREIPSSPLELALAPALHEGRWQVPPHFNFTADVVEALASEPKRRALTFLARDGVIEPRSFVQLADGAARWAAAFREQGVQAGDRVAVVLPTDADWIEALLGCLKIGAVAVPCPPASSYDTLRTRLSSPAPAVLVADAHDSGLLDALAAELDARYVTQESVANDEVDDVPTEDTAARDLAFLFWTSGTTGEPKLVAHTHGATFAARVAAEHWLGAGPRDTVWCTPGCGTANLVATVLGSWARGAEVVLADGDFTPSDRLDLIHRMSASIVCSTPAEYRSLVGLPELPRFRSTRLRRLVSTGDHLELDIVDTFRDLWGLTIHEGYGQAETGMVVASGDGPGSSRPGALGRPLPGQQVAVIDDAGDEVVPGSQGDLAVRGRPPTLFAGYWESPEDTKDAFRGDWYVTGDVAVTDDEGFVTYVGRATDLISTLGSAFGPHEIEHALRQHASVVASAAVGLRDLQRGGQFVRAFVVLRRGLEGTEQLGAELRHHVAESLPDHQVPREIEFVDELPTSRTGAVRRLELRERPITGRPLWEMPPTSEPESPVAEAPPLAPEALAEPTAVPFVAPVEPAPPPAALVEPIPPEPVVEPVVEPVAPDPVAPERRDVPEYVVDRAGEQDSRTAFVEPEVVEPETAELEVSEPPVAFVEPQPAVQPQVAPETVAAPEPVVEPEPELLVEPAAAPEDPSVAPAQGPEPEPEPYLPEFVVPPASLPEPPPVAPEPEPAAEIDAQLPEYVVDPGTVPEGPPVLPEPEPEPDVDSGPLPEYIVDPESSPQPVALRPPSAVEPEAEPDAEPDAGPLPEFIVDPDRPTASSPAEPLLRPPAGDPSAPEPPAIPLSDLALKPVTHFPTVGEPSEPGKRGRGLRRRQRPPQDPPDKPRRERSTGEPGDEPAEVSWMQGLSNRLSAYSVTGDEQPQAPTDDEAPTDDKSPPDDSTPA